MPGSPASSGSRCSTGTRITETAPRRSSGSDPDVLYVSLHQYPFYPGTGSRAERGGGAGEGATVNIPLAAGSSERGFMDAFEHEALRALREFDPGLLIVSAGFDAHRDDPLCNLGLSSQALRGADPRGAPASAPVRS